jgi:hypothetical protein
MRLLEVVGQADEARLELPPPERGLAAALDAIGEKSDRINKAGSK